MSKQILYVDTDVENQLLMRRIIQHAGYSSHTAVDHQQASELLNQHPYSLLFLTITEETAADSFDLVRELKKRSEQTAVIAVMHQADNHLKEKAFLSGCDGHLPKPADIRQVQALLQEMLLETAAVQPEASLVAAD